MFKSFLDKAPLNLKFSSKNSFQDWQPINHFLCSQDYEKPRISQTLKLTLLQANKENTKKRNSELMKLFKQTKPQYMNIEILQKSQFMKTNEIFYYLVNCLKKERQGLISVDTISEEKAKSPKPIEIKIRQFLYHSLQQSLLMSQKQVQESKYFERLFKWFTQVFKETEMKLSFKVEPSIKDSKQHDLDWIIRNTYKSSMPQELGEYHRKMLNTTQMAEFNKKISRKGYRVHNSDFQIGQESNPNQKIAIDSAVHTENGLEKKLFTQNTHYSSMHKKSNEILPLLARNGLHAQLSKLKQQKELQELQVYELQWKKLKAHFGQHLPKNFNNKIKLKQSKVGQMSLHNPKSSCKSKKSKENNCSFGLEPKIMDKIQAAKLGVTLTEFRKNKENILKQNNSVTYDSPVYHPYLTINYFHDIKKKKFEALRRTAFPKQFKYNPKKTDESEDFGSSNYESLPFQAQDDEEFNPAIPVQNIDEIVENIDGLGLSMNPLDKSAQKTKKNEGKK